ncbi:MAG: hypothetical protein ACU0CO_10970 [Shimia sp.]
MADGTKLYVAEIGGDGRVQCVWVQARRDKAARPFDPARDPFDPVAPAEFHGAAPEAIRSWLSLRQGSGPAATVHALQGVEDRIDHA